MDCDLYQSDREGFALASAAATALCAPGPYPCPPNGSGGGSRLPPPAAAAQVSPRLLPGPGKVETPITNQAPITNNPRFLQLSRFSKEGCTSYVHQNLLLELSHMQFSHLKFYGKFNTMTKILKKLAFNIFSISTQRKNIHLRI